MKLISITIILAFMYLAGCSGSDQAQHGWTSPQPIGTYASTITISSPATNSTGDVLINYVSGHTMYLNIYSQQSGWGQECQVGTNIFPGRLSLNDAGQGIFVYCETVDGVISQKAIQYSPALGWGTPQTIRSGIASNSSAWAATAPNGDVMVAWYEMDFVNGNSVYTAYYRQGAGWTTPVRLSNLLTDGDVFFAGITVNCSGKYLALWTERDNTSLTSTCCKSIFDPASGWSSPELLLSGVGDRIFTMSDMDDDGNAAISLYWTDGASLVETYLGRIGLNLPLELMPQPVTGTFLGSVPKMNSRGDAFVAWGDGVLPNPRIQGISYVHQNGWGSITMVQNDMATSSLRGDFCGLDDSGNAFVTGVINVGTIPLLSVTRYTATSGWAKPVTFTTDQQMLFNSSLVVSRGGKAALVWTGLEGTPAVTKAYISFYK